VLLPLSTDDVGATHVAPPVALQLEIFKKLSVFVPLGEDKVNCPGELDVDSVRTEVEGLVKVPT
jgi:hypothetical protein